MSNSYLVVYGNCQAGMLAQSIKFVPGIREQYLVHYVRSFDHPGEALEPVPAEVAENCAVYWRQYDEQGLNAPDGQIPSTAQKIVFPPLDCAPLWPFQCVDDAFPPEPPEFPFGRFPYGDRVLRELSAQTGLGNDVYQAYNERIRDMGLDPTRHVDMEFERLTRRDRGCDVRMAPFVISTFKAERLFWTYNHPTRRLFGELLDRMIRYTWPIAADRASHLYRIGRFIYREFDPFATCQIPICDFVGEELGLAWWKPGMVYIIPGFGGCTTETYCVLYVSERGKRKSL